MASRATGRKKILVPEGLHPGKFSVLKNYTEPAGIGIETFRYDRETGGLEKATCKPKSIGTPLRYIARFPRSLASWIQRSLTFPRCVMRRGLCRLWALIPYRWED